jgi:hypothetical protein
MPYAYNQSSRKATKDFEVLEMQSGGDKSWSGVRSKIGQTSIFRKNESEEDILPQHAVGRHDAYAGVASPTAVMDMAGITVRREYEVEVESRPA